MISPAQQLDRRFETLHPLTDKAARPAHGWIRAVRQALGMTMAQFGKRMGVSQPRVAELEKAETQRAITLQSLDRAAEALGCRVVYALVPLNPLQQTLEKRAWRVAAERLAALHQTMALEDQAVKSPSADELPEVAAGLLQRPSLLWNEP